MKTIGIIGALEEETLILKSKVEVVSAKNIVGVDFYMGKMHAKNVVIVRSGIGKVNAAICTQILIDLYAVDYVINTGVAGAIAKELEIGDVVISNDLVYHDFDATVTGEPIGSIPRMSQSTFRADEELIKLAKKAFSSISKEGNCFVERIATGDKFVSSKELKTRIWSDFRAYCTEMEGAAIAHTCYLNKIPFVVIRTMSDKSDDKSYNSYSNTLETVAKKSSNIVEELIKMI